MRFSLLILFFLCFCTPQSHDIERVEKHTITQITRKKQASIHEEISPKYCAILENGDTIFTTKNGRINDTIYYVFYRKTRFFSPPSSAGNSTKNSR